MSCSCLCRPDWPRTYLLDDKTFKKWGPVEDFEGPRKEEVMWFPGNLASFLERIFIKKSKMGSLPVFSLPVSPHGLSL